MTSRASKVTCTALAESDLLEIWEYIAEDSPANADRFIDYLDEKCRQWLVYLLALFSTTSTKKVLEFCRKFEVPERYQQLLLKEKLAAAKVVRILNGRTSFANSEIYWLLKELSHEGLLYLIAITRKQSGKKAVSLFVTHLRYTKPELQGDDLIHMGYSPGPLFKKILTRLLDAKLDGLVQSKKEEAALVKKEYPWDSPENIQKK